MNAWSVQLKGTKTEILKALSSDTTVPDPIKIATAAMFEVLPDIPGYTDSEPGVWYDSERAKSPEKFLDEIKGILKRPPDRDTYLNRTWRIYLDGSPEHFGVTRIQVEAVYEAK